MQDIRSAAEIIGSPVISAVFVYRALEWLKDNVQDLEIKYVEDSWIISGQIGYKNVIGGDTQLSDALCSAIFLVDHALNEGKDSSI